MPKARSKPTALNSTSRSNTRTEEVCLTSPRLRGEVGAHRQIRDGRGGTFRECEFGERAPHPNPLPAKGGASQKKHLNSSPPARAFPYGADGWLRRRIRW